MKDVKEVLEQAVPSGIRSIDINGDPWFVGIDIVNAIGYSNSSLLRKVKDENRKGGVTGGNLFIKDSLGRKAFPVFVNAAGVVDMVTHCNLPKAKELNDLIFADEAEQLTEQTDEPYDEVKDFLNKRFGAVRTSMIDDELWFVANDVAKAFGYSNPSNSIRNLDLKYRKQGERGITPYFEDEYGRKQYPNLVNKTGVYELAARSNQLDDDIKTKLIHLLISDDDVSDYPMCRKTPCFSYGDIRRFHRPLDVLKQYIENQKTSQRQKDKLEYEKRY